MYQIFYHQIVAELVKHNDDYKIWEKALTIRVGMRLDFRLLVLPSDCDRYSKSASLMMVWKLYSNTLELLIPVTNDNNPWREAMAGVVPSLLLKVESDEYLKKLFILYLKLKCKWNPKGDWEGLRFQILLKVFLTVHQTKHR